MTFTLATGSERKSTGSYYTRPELVRELIESALVPVMEDRLKQAKDKNGKEQALLSMTVCDPACGSGHFLLAAAHRLGRELAKVKTGEDEPTPEQFHLAVRDVISHCIYGVDVNPLAVDLCKLALWLEGHWTGKPLSFLDHRIKCGNSLIGVLDPKVLKDGIPDAAFTPVTGDDKKIAQAFKKRNKEESKGRYLAFSGIDSDIDQFAASTHNIDEMLEDTPADVKRKQQKYEEWRGKPDWWHDWTTCNIWTAAFFAPLIKLDDPAVPTHDRFMRFVDKRDSQPQMAAAANALAEQLRFFHWRLEFPQVFEKGGFDVVLGNPPWERVKLQEQEFFMVRHPSIAQAQNKAAREILIEALGADAASAGDRELANEWCHAKHAAEATTKFLRKCGRFPFTGVGDVNVYAPFAETSLTALRSGGRAGIIIPSGVATDSTTKLFFGQLIENGFLAQFYEFENEGFFSAGQGHMVRFGLTTFVKERSKRSADFVFQAKAVTELHIKERHFELTAEDVSLLNPNTLTCPIFQTKTDAKLTKKLYRCSPVLVNEADGVKGNPWSVSYMAMFHMANDSELFKTANDLSTSDAVRCGTDWKGAAGERYVRLYESKMMYLYNHRHGDFNDANGERVHKLPEVPERRLSDPGYCVEPFYWIRDEEVTKRLRSKDWGFDWLLAWRDVTDARASERTVVFAIIPRSGVGHNAPLLFASSADPVMQVCLLANFSSLPLDYAARQKVGGLHLTIFVLNQLPVLSPGTFTSDDRLFIVPRAMELVYTASDLDELGRAFGYSRPFSYDPVRRMQLRAELDAYYAHLYGLTREEVRYILNPKDVFGEDFPSETFRVLQDRETKVYGEYRTRRLVLEAFDKLADSPRFRDEVPKRVSAFEVPKKAVPVAAH